MKLYIVVSGLLSNQDGILMVGNKWRPEDPILYSLPGGRWEQEQGETLTEALIREMKEETGILVDKVGDLIYLVESISPSRQEHFINMVFRIESYEKQNIELDTDDEFVVDAKYIARDDIKKLTMLPSFREPLINYLDGSAKKYYQYLKTFSEDI